MVSQISTKKLKKIEAIYQCFTYLTVKQFDTPTAKITILLN